MWGKITKAEWKRLPKLYATDDIPLKDKDIILHFFIGSCDWYIVEGDQKEGLFFGYANLGDDMCSEWGYVSLQELKDIKIGGWLEVDKDKFWRVQKASSIDRIIFK